MSTEDYEPKPWEYVKAMAEMVTDEALRGHLERLVEAIR